MTIKHGMSGSAMYFAWAAMIQRCENPKATKYHLYGGRGISVCPKWHTFEGFFEDMGIRPEGTTLDRKEPSLGYFKENCRWVTPREQNLNLRVRSDNTSGVKGVGWKKQIGRWVARVHVDSSEILLYCGTDFFEACCARKSWEANLA